MAKELSSKDAKKRPSANSKTETSKPLFHGTFSFGTLKPESEKAENEASQTKDDQQSQEVAAGCHPLPENRE